MYYHSKIIAMFAVLIIHILLNAGSELAFSVQAFFMPGHIVYHIWYPCTPVWSVNAPTAFSRCDKQRERHGYFHFKNLLLYLTMQKFPPLLLTASERPPTKRVLLPSPLPAILSPTLPPTASTFMGAPFATCVRPTRTAIQLLVDSISPVVKRQQVPPVMKLLFSSWSQRTKSAVVTWRNAISISVNVIMHPGCLVIRAWCSITVTSPSCSRFPYPAISLLLARPASKSRLCRISTPIKKQFKTRIQL